MVSAHAEKATEMGGRVLPAKGQPGQAPPLAAKPKYLITNLAYGETFAKLFLDHHLRSVLDPSNIPAVAQRYDLTYLIYTDEETSITLARHPNFLQLGRICRLEVRTIVFPPEIQRYEARYGVQVQTYQEAAKMALDSGAFFSSWAADAVVAKEFIPRILRRMEEGHDAVLSVPLRGTAESMAGPLSNESGALSDRALFQLAYDNQHPLWVASHVANEQFSRIPFTLLWNSGKGLLSHSFSVSPMIVTPNAAICATNRVCDSEIAALCKNPFWAHDWTDAPMASAEPVACYYPPWGNRRIDLRGIGEWSRQLAPNQINDLKHTWYFPSKAECGFADDELSMVAVGQITNAHHEAAPKASA